MLIRTNTCMLIIFKMPENEISFRTASLFAQKKISSDQIKKFHIPCIQQLSRVQTHLHALIYGSLNLSEMSNTVMEYKTSIYILSAYSYLPCSLVCLPCHLSNYLANKDKWRRIREIPPINFPSYQTKNTLSPSPPYPSRSRKQSLKQILYLVINCFLFPS